MKQLFFIVSIIMLGFAASAQELDYPNKKLIDAQNFEKAEKAVLKDVEKDPQDVQVNFSAYKLYDSKSYNGYNVRTAYDYLLKSYRQFTALLDKAYEKVQKDGFNNALYETEFRNVCAEALKLADNQNTVDAYNNFLNYYRQCSVDQTVEATQKRNAAAFRLAESANTLDAYRNFVSTYPNASEVPSAWANIYKIEYANAQRQNTEQAYQSYIRNYPKSPYVSQAQAMVAKFQFYSLTTQGDIESYQRYIKTHNTAMVSVAQDSICAIVKRDPKMDNILYGLKNFSGAQYDKMAMLFHNACADAGMYDFSEFWNNCSPNNLSSLKKHDDQILSAFNYGSAEEFIRTAAPYYCAYKALTIYIEDDLEAKDFDAALQKVLEFQNDFGSDKNYICLLNTLQLPIDNNVKITVLNANVNTKDGLEYAPAPSADGKSLLFCGRNRKDNLGLEDIYISALKSGVWQKSKLFPDVNTAWNNEAPEALSVSGTELLMFQEGKLCQSDKTKSGWTSPQLLNDNINFCDWQADPTFSSDGNVMIFAAKSQSSYEISESTNIFVSVKDEYGEWGPAFEIGNTINTPFTDRSPMLHPDMKTLYFCSDGHGSLGKMDVFMSKRLSDDSWTEWSEPVNIGKELNTVGTECFYKISTDGKTAYFSKSVDDNEDIFAATIPERVRPNPVATISGTLVDLSGNPISTNINWEDLETHEVIGQSETDPMDGSYFIVLPEGKNYGYFINDKEHFPTSSNIDLRKKNELIHIDNNISVVSIDEMVEKQIPIVLNNLFFNTAEWDLLPASISELQRVYKILTERNLKVEISGHTDNVGDDNSNQALSENRANSVKQYLMQLGYPEGKLTTVGYGEKKPVASNSTPEGRQKNRRVEMRVVK